VFIMFMFFYCNPAYSTCCHETWPKIFRRNTTEKRPISSQFDNNIRSFYQFRGTLVSAALAKLNVFN